MVSTAVVLIPSPTPELLRLVAESDDGSDHSVRIDSHGRYTVRTIERSGKRINADGGVYCFVDDVRAFAYLAVKELLLSATSPGSTRDEEILRLRRMDDDAQELGDKVFDASVWSVVPILVDGTKFALWVHTSTVGFAGVADLGPHLVTLHGSTIPEVLEFSMKELGTLTFEMN
ncbi:hypothetical protein KPL76_12825 [Subtercola sp. PAMC28395]|uniref:hypothetical protein n=1 Tax=Subtercola sp. PAMC28395 TaxID=2846775 RepID=UPI001C0C8CAF|nr:hypothetical protein [Subtercola sp. PAMC28395]QWT23574.1 hypothetical protein KPL76_12825 [Subtercola sp. PAMC28395]